MSRAITIAVIAISLLGSVGTPSSGSVGLKGSMPAETKQLLGPPIIKAHTQDQHDMATWAVGRYATAGLGLPRVTIEFASPVASAGLAACDGAQGRTYLDQTPILVKICWNDKFVLLHELAHVWEAINANETDREAFMELRSDVTAWADPDDAWEDQGREHAANVIAWGVLADPIVIGRTYPNDPMSMIGAFSTITGVAPLHDGGEGVIQPDRTAFAHRDAPQLVLGR